MVEKKQTKKQNSKTNIKNKEPVSKGKSSSLIIGSIIIVIISVLLTVAFPYLKDNLNSITTTTNPVDSTKTEKVTNVVKPQQEDSEFHPTLIISSNDDESGSKYEFKCTFENNETTKALLEQLPLTMTMVDLNGSEKYHTLKKPLPVKIEPVDKVRLGDILLFSDRYLAVFYKTIDPVKKYSIVGKVDNPEDLPKIVGTGSITASLIPNKKN